MPTNEGQQRHARFLPLTQMVNLALLSAIAYVVMVFGRIPVVLFLKYDPKDVIIVIAGLIYGPFSSFMVSLVVSFVEMVTVSDTGWIGFAMNLLSTCCFACPAAYLYKKKQSLVGAIIGLVIGGLLTVAVMLLWNYLLTPIFMNMDRAIIVPMLWSAFLPFNLLKVTLNAALTMLIYKPVVGALRKANLIPPSTAALPKAKRNLGVILVSACVLLTCILYLMASNGVF